MRAHFIRGEEEVRRPSLFPSLTLLSSLLASLMRTSSTWQIMRKIRAELGVRGLFTGTRSAEVRRLPRCSDVKTLFFVSSSGFMPRVFKVAPACAIMISSYEFGKATFEKMNRNRE